jgi:O-antigen/teichoic acid export membrane protein
MGAGSVGLVLIRKELDFAREFRYTLFSRLFTLVITITLAIVLRNYWAIVFGTAAGVIFECWLSYRMHPYRARLSLAKARMYLSFSAALVPLNICSYLAMKVDSFVVGRIGPAATLGIYNMAAELSAMLTSELTAKIGRALYPSYATLTSERARLREAFLTSFSALVIVNAAFGLGLLAVSEDFVAVVLGAKWKATVPLIEWLAVAGMLRAIMGNLTGGILIVSGRERAASILTFVRFAVLAACSIAGGHLGGVQGVAVGVTLGIAVLIPIGAVALVRLLGFGFADLARVAWRPVVAGAAMLVMVRLLHASSVETPAITLALDVVTGAVVFLGTLGALWWLSGRPEGAEKMVVNAVASRMRSPAKE